jgi:hypothetical protein
MALDRRRFRLIATYQVDVRQCTLIQDAPPNSMYYDLTQGF